MKPVDKANHAERSLSRSGFIWPRSGGPKLRDLQKTAFSASWDNLVWKWRELGISASGRRAAENLDLVPSLVFAHPDVIATHPELADYYRFVAHVPMKGRDLIKSPSGTNARLAFCRLVNRASCSLVSAAAKFSQERLFNPIFAGAAKREVKKADPSSHPELEFIEMLVNYAIKEDLVDWEATERLAKQQSKNAQEINQDLD